MSSETILNNYSDDSQIKRYIIEKLAPQVFHNIPLNVLNTGEFSLINEYISQATEQMAFTSSFYLNESFITKSILPDSIYAEAAIFGIGYAFATPSCTNLLLELKLDDIYKNAKKNVNGFMEFILDKNTKFNLSNGNVYSLDYDISIQFKDVKTSTVTAPIPAWNVKYINTDEMNSIAVNKTIYIPYRVTDQWLCLFVNVSEFERQTYTIPCNMANGIANEDRVITCRDHICGFDIKYIKSDGSYQYIPHDHILPMHSVVEDSDPYVHYIMDNQQSVRFMFQLQGNNFFKPELNSSYEITMYTCHGKAANFTKYDETDQPKVLTSGRRYSNNGNVLKAAFVIGASLGGTNIGTAESVRRKTIEAYNTANVLSTDHDIDEWLKTFYFENLLYPFFFKRRDDPWGRIWSGYLALKDSDDYVFRTNTLHAQISYDQLYNNNDNTMSDNEVIIPPGWLWKYMPGDKRHIVIPYTQFQNKIETPKSLTVTNEPYVFSNPFGIRIQKKPFAIGYFNPWINQYISTSKINMEPLDYAADEKISIYHATPLYVHIERTYKDNYYKLSTYIDPTVPGMINGDKLVEYFKQIENVPVFPELMWSYFHYPLNLYASIIPISIMSNAVDGDTIFDPNTTYLCVRDRNKMMVDDNTDGIWNLADMWILDEKDPSNVRRIDLNITGELDYIYGLDELWGNQDLYECVYVTGDTTIKLETFDEHALDVEFVSFDRVDYRDYYDMKLNNDIKIPIDDETIRAKVCQIVIKTSYAKKTNKTRTQHSESVLYDIGKPTRDKNAIVEINVTYYWYDENAPATERTTNPYQVRYTIHNAKRVCIPYDAIPTETEDHMYEFVLGNLVEPMDPDTIVLYADMHPSPESNTIDYYKFPFIKMPDNKPIFYIKQHALPLEKNKLRVVLKAQVNGGLTGYVEMTPIKHDTDGTYLFETDMFPLNQLLDVDNMIHIASIDVGSGDWKPTPPGSYVAIDALNPDLTMSILLKNDYSNYNSTSVPTRIMNDKSYDDYLVIDEYALDDFSLVQEMKEMRSVVNFGSPLSPTIDQYSSYIELLQIYDTWLYAIHDYASQQVASFNIDVLALNMIGKIIEDNDLCGLMEDLLIDRGVFSYIPESMQPIIDCLNLMGSVIKNRPYCQTDMYDSIHNAYYNPTNGSMYATTDFTSNPLTPITNGCYLDITTNKPYFYDGKEYIQTQFIIWENVRNLLGHYTETVHELYKQFNVDGGLEIQQVPFVEYTLMNSKRFTSFVSAFTNVHKALEPVIFKRLEGNHYLDCKLLATYGLPHSYTSDLYSKYEDDIPWWPDLNIQLEFDVKLFNNAISINTINELKLIVKSYFNRLTSLHTATDLYSINNNIYISHIIQQMESHDNVAYMKFKGWYTNQRNIPNGHYKDATHQAIVQRYQRLEDMPKHMLEYYVPEMFTLDDDNIVINVIK
jgi:hypothetical protein